MMLNIEENIKMLVVKALNKHRYKTKAAQELGMTRHNLRLLVNKYNIKKVNNQYEQQGG